MFTSLLHGQTSFAALDEAIKLTNRRVNALDNVVIPRIVATIAYIDSELSEIEREEIFRCVWRGQGLYACMAIVPGYALTRVWGVLRLSWVPCGVQCEEGVGGQTPQGERGG